jgi:hypothetical protein
LDREVGRRSARQTVGPLRELGEVLGRLGFGSTVWENTRPLLGPIYAWVTALPKGALLQIPAVIQLILGFWLQVYSDGPIRVSCGTWQEPQEELFRADAKAEGDDVAIGGWLCAGGLAPADAPWFAMKITRKLDRRLDGQPGESLFSSAR